LMSPMVATGWTNHSERATLTSALAAIGVDKARRDVLGRWSPSGSDDYVRTYKAVVKDLISRFCCAASSGRGWDTFDEEDAMADITVRVRATVHADEETIDQVMAEFSAVSKNLAQECAEVAPEAAPTEVASLSPMTEVGDEIDEDRDAKFLIVYTRNRRDARLHKVDGCWRARKMDFADYELTNLDPIPRESYNMVCKQCWPQDFIEPSAEPVESEGDSSSSDSETEGD